MRPGPATLRRRLQGLMFRLPGMISCEEFEAFVLDYLEGDLSGPALSRFERHLRICRECREYLVAYKAALASVRDLGEEDLKKLEDVPEDLIQAILSSK